MLKHKKKIVSALWVLSVLIGLFFGFYTGIFLEHRIIEKHHKVLAVLSDLDDLILYSKSPSQLKTWKTNQFKIYIYGFICSWGQDMNESEAHILAKIIKRYNALEGGKLLAGHSSPMFLRQSQARRYACKKLTLPD